MDLPQREPAGIRSHLFAAGTRHMTRVKEQLTRDPHRTARRGNLLHVVRGPLRRTVVWAHLDDNALALVRPPPRSCSVDWRVARSRPVRCECRGRGPGPARGQSRARS